MVMIVNSSELRSSGFQGQHSVLMKYTADVIFAFTSRVLVDTVGRKTFDHRLPVTCLEEIHERGHILEVLNDIPSHSNEFNVYIVVGLGFAARRNFVQQVGEVFNEFAIDHIRAAFKLEQKFSKAYYQA